ncbi:RNA-directed DNA polymerase [Dehalogenimonas etheniformans]|uniref:RNA-directed DNA polymerase n=1 Tax=Dehalogenimonas etheniformans TaxID=1536648 RepID=A0A2P5P536_9CHLR|nr:RNA-directed DNA polymerase [Dehalogenimonas etheniformans]QNT77190.1 RNA-directed DNA polymerase [Dehalogenimonas etheniformans]
MSHKLNSPPQDLAKSFSALKDGRDVAKLLEVEYAHLVYHLYKIPQEARYSQFKVKKRGTNEFRTISIPNGSLKIIQTKLVQVLEAVYFPRIAVHGFIKGKSILSNARIHANQKWVFNADLEGFFPSINFGRVRGLFIAKPYVLPDNVATVLAQICCYNNELPQGAPTSPILSNMVCAKLDSELRILAQHSRCNYTRYADDLTFSTSSPKFPPQIASIDGDSQNTIIELGEQLRTIIGNNGFCVNAQKTRLQTKTHRQEVTGLVTNQFPNVSRQFIRQVRAMLHAWEKFGLEKAQTEYLMLYRDQQRNPLKNDPKYRNVSLKDVILGKIGFIGSIRGKTDFIYIKLLNKVISLSPELAKQKDKISALMSSGPAPLIRVTTEGPTDWMHIETAFNNLQSKGLFAGLAFDLVRYEHDMGHSRLLSICEAYATLPIPGGLSHVFIFDRDEPQIVNKVNEHGDVRKWPNNVYSFSIPIPTHRTKTPEICIELN